MQLEWQRSVNYSIDGGANTSTPATRQASVEDYPSHRQRFRPDEHLLQRRIPRTAPSTTALKWWRELLRRRNQRAYLFHRRLLSRCNGACVLKGATTLWRAIILPLTKALRVVCSLINSTIAMAALTIRTVMVCVTSLKCWVARTTACNFNINATEDDGSCGYGGSCSCRSIPDTQVSISFDNKVDSFDSDSIEDAQTQIDALFVNMEHSYMGDLTITLIAPTVKASWCISKVVSLPSSAFLLTMNWPLIHQE